VSLKLPASLSDGDSETHTTTNRGLSPTTHSSWPSSEQDMDNLTVNITPVSGIFFFFYFSLVEMMLWQEDLVLAT
jgi:hypothetical protein